MNFIWDKLTEWIRELLIEGIMNNLTGLFDQVNTQISGIADNVGKTPQQWNGSIFSMIQGLSDHVVVPIAGAILAVIATLELIQLIIDKNNFHDFDTFIIFKWVFKTAASVLIVSNTWNIVMGIFEAAQSVVSRASGLVMWAHSCPLKAQLRASKRVWPIWSWARFSVSGFRRCSSVLPCGRW